MQLAIAVPEVVRVVVVVKPVLRDIEHSVTPDTRPCLFGELDTQIQREARICQFDQNSSRR